MTSPMTLNQEMEMIENMGANAVPAPRHSGSAPSPSVSAIRRVSAFAALCDDLLARQAERNARILGGAE